MIDATKLKDCNDLAERFPRLAVVLMGTTGYIGRLSDDEEWLLDVAQIALRPVQTSVMQAAGQTVMGLVIEGLPGSRAGLVRRMQRPLLFPWYLVTHLSASDDRFGLYDLYRSVLNHAAKYADGEIPTSG